MPSRPYVVLVLALFGSVSLSALAAHADNSTVEITYRGHRFSPENLDVPAGAAVTIKVVNASNETIEFESFRLNREKAIQPGEAIAVRLPALSAGSYDFYDDFHQDVPQGSIVAK